MVMRVFQKVLAVSACVTPFEVRAASSQEMVLLPSSSPQ